MNAARVLAVLFVFAGAGANTPDAAGPAVGANTPDAAAQSAAAAAAAAAAKKKRLEWCRREYVDAKDCDKWVANELGQGLKKADQERDREDAERDREEEQEDKQRDEEDYERNQEDKKRDEEDAERNQEDKKRDEEEREGGTKTASAAGPVMLFAGAGTNTPDAAGPAAAAAGAAAAAADAAAAAAAAKKKRLEWCRREYVDAKDCDKWVANELGQGLKKADQERDREDAERDREDELRDAERDQEDKKRDEEDRMRDAEHDGADSLTGTKGADAAPPAQTSLWSLVLAADAGAPEKKESNGWMNDLTAEQRAKLKRDLAHLDRKSKKEQAIASQDGPGASEIMRREYVRKAARVLKGYKKKAAANRDAKSSAASEAESAKSVPDVAPTVTKTQGTPKETDSQP